jgi:hypothetical protein
VVGLGAQRRPVVRAQLVDQSLQRLLAVLFGFGAFAGGA